MDYFYCLPEKISKSSLLIDGDEYAHLVHVMRKKEGDQIRVVDGAGTAYDVRLGVLKKHMAEATILKVFHNHNEPSTSVTLAVGILKNPSKFDFLVEKVTELGVKHIVPLSTQRTIPNHAKVERWQKLALAAMKQCGRSYLPIVSKLMTLDELLSQRDRFDLHLIAHEQAEGAINVEKLLTKKPPSVLIVVGPEGGFDDDEVKRCRHAGFHQIYFGERRLRTETAAIVATSIVMLTDQPHH
jgi:16S rRNA (uracil1498-N3)-methyltransferase